MLNAFEQLCESTALYRGNVHIDEAAVGKSARDAKARLVLEERARRVLRHSMHGRWRLDRKPAAFELLRKARRLDQRERRRIAVGRARHAVELRSERGEVASRARGYLFAVRELREVERGYHVVHAIVVVFVFGESPARKFPRRRLVVAADERAPAALDAFCEPDNAEVAVRTARLALVIAAERVARELYHGHAVALAQRRQNVEVSDRTERVIDDDGGRQLVLQARPHERRLERCGRHAARRRVAIDKHRRRVHARHSRHIGIERKRRHEHVIAPLRAAKVERGMQRRVRRAHNDARSAVQRVERGFELSHVIRAAERIAHRARRAACPVEKHHKGSMRRNAYITLCP